MAFALLPIHFALMVATTPCPPFYEPGAPPPPLPLLTAQTNLLDNPFRPTTLINTEPLPQSGAMRVNQRACQRKVQVAPHTHSAPTLESSSDSPASDSSESESSGSSESESSDSTDGTIPKPPGEVGRPGRGGYTLDDALDWNPKAFKKLKVR